MACVAATPTPASAHSTPLPTENTRDCTAPPTSPVAGSNPRIENVATGGHGSGGGGVKPTLCAPTTAGNAVASDATIANSTRRTGNEGRMGRVRVDMIMVRVIDGSKLHAWRIQHLHSIQLSARYCQRDAVQVLGSPCAQFAG